MSADKRIRVLFGSLALLVGFDVLVTGLFWGYGSNLIRMNMGYLPGALTQIIALLGLYTVYNSIQASDDYNRFHETSITGLLFGIVSWYLFVALSNLYVIIFP